MSFYSGGLREPNTRTCLQTDALRCENPVDSGTAGRTRAWRQWPHGGGASRGTGPNHPEVGSGEGQTGDCGAIGDRAANRKTLGKALSAARDEGFGGRAAVGTAAPHPARADRPHRAEDHPGNAFRFHPLEYAELGPSGEREPLLGGTDLALEESEATSSADVQAQQ